MNAFNVATLVLFVVNMVFLGVNMFCARSLCRWQLSLRVRERSQKHFANTLYGRFLKNDMLSDSEKGLIQAIFDKPPYVPSVKTGDGDG